VRLAQLFPRPTLRESVATRSDILRLEHKIDLAVRDMTIRMGLVGVAIVAILASLKFFGS
jgi:hypothetical protein